VFTSVHTGQRREGITGGPAWRRTPRRELLQYKVLKRGNILLKGGKSEGLAFKERSLVSVPKGKLLSKLWKGEDKKRK